MPIQGLTEKFRLPRLGKIKLGTKNERGLPQKSDHFVCPPEVKAVYGEKPTSFDILIPVEDAEQWASQYYRCYSNVRGLLCRGDGGKCFRIVDKATGKIADRETKEIEGREMACAGRECDYYIGKRCKEVMFLQFLLPDVPGLGIWQIDTGSINSIRNINSCAALIRGLYGHIAMVPLQLTLEQIEVNNPTDGKKQKAWVLNLRSNQTLLAVVKAANGLRQQLGAPALALPAPDDEVPEDIVSDEEEPQSSPPATKEQVAQDTEELFGSLKSASPSPVTGGASIPPPVLAQATTAAAGSLPAARQPGQVASSTASAPAGAVQGGGAPETEDGHPAAPETPTFRNWGDVAGEIMKLPGNKGKAAATARAVWDEVERRNPGVTVNSWMDVGLTTKTPADAFALAWHIAVAQSQAKQEQAK